MRPPFLSSEEAVFGGGEASLAAPERSTARKRSGRRRPQGSSSSSSSFIILSVFTPPHLRFPSELQLLGHFGGNVSEGQRRPPQALEPHTAALAQPAGQLADLGLEGNAGAGRSVGAGQEERPGQVDLAAAALRRLAQR